MQIQAGRYFLHEHPKSASSWKEQCVQRVLGKQNVEAVTGHMCRWGMMSTDEQGEGSVKKPDTFMTNSPMIAKELSQICNGGHRHVHLVSGRAKHAQVYPEDLCLAILRELKCQLTIDKKLRPHEPLLQVCEESDTRFHELLNLNDDVEYMDDVTGKMLEKLWWS